MLIFILFLDLQFSSEEELDEVPLHEFEDSKTGILISAELPNMDENADDDSQQAAEAMVQLGTMGYYQGEEGTEQLMFKGILWFVLFYFYFILNLNLTSSAN